MALWMVANGAAGGPACFYSFVDALVSAGREAGLPHEQAVRPVKQTCLGAAHMLMETDDAPSVVYCKVMSSGDTTEAAFNDLNANNAFDYLKSAVLAEHRRTSRNGRPRSPAPGR
jgi:pyrroline-5-carboxylate reductase